MRKKTKGKAGSARAKPVRRGGAGAAKSAGGNSKPSAGRALGVCLLSPHPFVLENLRNLLHRPKFEVHAERVEFLPGQGSALPALPEAEVFVLDANGPLRAVVALISRVKGEHPGSRVVVVSDELTEETAFPLMRLGIRGLLRYADAATQLAAAVLSVNEGGYWVPRLLLSRFVFGILDQPRLPVPGEARKLSPRERQVHEALLENLSNKEIASRLNLSERTVKFHVSNVLAKHRVRRRADLILQNYHARPFESGGEHSPGG
ncbi:MAG TPA: response regulator transcription factor [Candidatus Acidoferrales bacterium]|nr:response regulator transcription factor [Candidatus Acidoferrales bacterium]